MKENINPAVGAVIVVVVVAIIVYVGMALISSKSGPKTPPKEKQAEIEQQQKAFQHFMGQRNIHASGSPPGAANSGAPGTYGRTGSP